jgi:thiazole synthase
LGDKEFSSRLLIGTGKYGSTQEMVQGVTAARPSLVTVALKRFDLQHPEEDLYSALLPFQEWLTIMPNTSGAKNSEEAYQAAHIGRELSGSPFVKIEIHPDSYHLMPDPMETFDACRRLTAEGFWVLPYIQADPLLAQRLQEIGVAAVMPLGSPIGSGQGLVAEPFIKIIIEQAKVPVIVDAGIRSPSDAARAMELGSDAVLINTALAMADNPALMGEAFARAVSAGHDAFRAGLMDRQDKAQASSLTSFLGGE